MVAVAWEKEESQRLVSIQCLCFGISLWSLSQPIASNSDFLTRKYTKALQLKKASAAALADAEESCQEWESILHHFGSEVLVQDVIKANKVVNDGDLGTMRGRYIAAITHINLQDFCQFRQ